MPSGMKKARVTVDAVRVRDIINVTPTQPIEEEDTSVIDQAEDNFSPRIEIEKGSAQLAGALYVDLTDPGQAALGLGVTGIEVVLTPQGTDAGMLRQTYSNCIVSQWDLQTIEYKGRLKRNFALKANGGMVEDTIP